MRAITEIGAELGLTPDDLEQYGPYKAKLNAVTLERLRFQEQGKLVLVTGMTPTTAGEGKTTTSIGLTQGLRQREVGATVCLREPSIGPVMGIKGGGTGGGAAQVLPADEINLHFTGDLHAVTVANNLLAAAVDASIFHGNPLNLDVRRVTWRRCLDINDRALRHVVVGLGNAPDGVPRQEGFDITPASEVMAILSVASDFEDLHRRLGAVIVGYTHDFTPVRCAEIGVDAAMAVLLRQAVRPNLVQTSEGAPALVHGGPFANIALGCNSIVATRAALALSEVVVTEAGFGSDLGAEKFLNVVSRFGELQPEVGVLVATARAIKRHGGRDAADLEVEDLAALAGGLANLDAHIDNMEQHGLTPVVAVNRFPNDTDAEVTTIVEHCAKRGVRAAPLSPYDGGEACLELADAVRDALAAGRGKLQQLYIMDSPIKEKIDAVSRAVYGADGAVYQGTAERTIERAERMGMAALPICIAKTQYSLSDDPTLLGRPKGHSLHVREVRPAAGARFLVIIAGDIMTMPGLPKVPAATKFSTAEGAGLPV